MASELASKLVTLTTSEKSKEPTDNSFETYSLGDFHLQSGETLPNAHIAFRTFGNPSLPVAIYPTWFSGAISDNLWLLPPALPHATLSPGNFYIIIPALFGAGQSTSPSNTPHLRPFPTITLYDNIRAHHQLVTEHLGVKHARLVLGWSMGAQQTYQWATQYPDFIDGIVPFCGSARTSIHNQVFLEGVKSALLAGLGATSLGSGQGWTVSGEQEANTAVLTKDLECIRRGLKAFGRGYAGWGFSQAFYREKLYETALGYRDLEDFMVDFWEKWALKKDPENLLSMLQTWQNGDCSLQPPYNGDFELAMRSIKAKALVLPGLTDLYFPPEDSEYEVKNMSPGIGKMEAFPSIWGHWAGGPGESKEDVEWLNKKIKEFLEDCEDGFLRLCRIAGEGKKKEVTNSA